MILIKENEYASYKVFTIYYDVDYNIVEKELEYLYQMSRLARTTLLSSIIEEQNEKVDFKLDNLVYGLDGETKTYMGPIPTNIKDITLDDNDARLIETNINLSIQDESKYKELNINNLDNLPKEVKSEIFILNLEDLIDLKYKLSTNIITYTTSKYWKKIGNYIKNKIK